MTNLARAEFLASIPPIMSGIKTGGDGMRVQFDIPENQMLEGAKLIGMRGTRLKITVEILTGFDNEIEKDTEGSTSKVDRRRSIKR